MASFTRRTTSSASTARSISRPDEEVLLIIKSADVLHSFFLPNLRMKQDVVPGMEQYMWFKCREPTAAVRHRVCRAVRLGPLQDEGPGHVRAAQRIRRLARGKSPTEQQAHRIAANNAQVTTDADHRVLISDLRPPTAYQS